MVHKDTFNRDMIFNGSKGLLYIGEKILVYRRDNKTENSPMMIDLPGGGRENSESPFETFKRELFEEFGLKINEENITYSNTHQSVIDPSKESFFLVAKLPASEENNIVFGNEGIEFYLLSTEDYLKRSDVIERHKQRVLEYLGVAN